MVGFKRLSVVVGPGRTWRPVSIEPMIAMLRMRRDWLLYYSIDPRVKTPWAIAATTPLPMHRTLKLRSDLTFTLR